MLKGTVDTTESETEVFAYQYRGPVAATLSTHAWYWQ